MIITTPPLSIKTINVFAALFKAQLPDTLSVMRRSLKEWMAVHVIVEQVGALRRTLTKEQMCQEILDALKPEATLLEPIFRLTTPEIPPNTVATYVPDVLKPTLAPEYQGWEFVSYRDARARLKKILTAAIGGEPEGQIGVASALAGEFKGQAVLEGWAGSIAAPSFKRTLEGVVEQDTTITFWDTAFGFETPKDEFLAHADRVLGMPDQKHDRLFFGDSYGWFLAFHPGGRMRVGMLS